jgi:putative glutathione S-transferase
LGTAPKDPLYGFTLHKELYLKADPEYQGRFTVPVLWDTKHETIVNNESSEIMKMLFSVFDALLPPERRESAHPNGGYCPKHLQQDIDDINAWIYDTVNNGVYKTGFATTQAAYESHIIPLFASMDRLEAILAKSDGSLLFGKYVTEADIRLYTTLIRFDVAYHTIFKCNLKMIRHDYPHLQKFIMTLYYDESEETRGAFKDTTHFDHIKNGYGSSMKHKIVPLGPEPDIYRKELL